MHIRSNLWNPRIFLSLNIIWIKNEYFHDTQILCVKYKIISAFARESDVMRFMMQTKDSLIKLSIDSE